MLKLLLMLCLSLILISCSSDSDDTTGSNTYTTPQWQSNTFADAATFKNHCEIPRTGNDTKGVAYPDMQGSYADEKFWLRSWSNDTYLWYNEIVDVDPTGSHTPKDYFSLLKTPLKTPIGAAKDRFHFTLDTEENAKTTQSGVSFSYGLEYVIQTSSPPRKAVVAYVVENSPADVTGFVRGDEFIEINGENFANGEDTDKLNDGLFPTDKSPTHSFKMKRVNGEEYAATLTAKDLVEPPVLLNKTYVHNPGGANEAKFAYVMLNTFNTYKAEAALYNTFNAIVTEQTSSGDNVDELVLDLRYNGGGYVYIASELAYIVAGNTIPSGGFFEQDTFNDKHPIINPVTGNKITPTPFYNSTSNYDDDLQGNLRFPTLNLKRVFILATDSTCSASESLINGLSGIDVDIVLIGGKTCGKPYGLYYTDNCGTTYATIQLKGANTKGFGEYSDGFIPTTTANPAPPFLNGCTVPDDFSKPLGDTSEALFNAALNYDVAGCPIVATTKSSVASQPKPAASGGDLLDDPRMQLQIMRKNSAIYIDMPEVEAPQ